MYLLMYTTQKKLRSTIYFHIDIILNQLISNRYHDKKDRFCNLYSYVSIKA